VSTKVCTKCKMEKDVSEFGPKRSVKSGLKARCKPCLSEDNSIWLKSNNIDRVDYLRQYYLNNRRQLREAHRAYYADNSSTIKERVKSYVSANREEVNRKNRERSSESVRLLKTSYLRLRTGLMCPPQELIDLKREQLLTYRATKELQQTVKEIQNATE